MAVAAVLLVHAWVLDGVIGAAAPITPSATSPQPLLHLRAIDAAHARADEHRPMVEPAQPPVPVAERSVRQAHARAPSGLHGGAVQFLATSPLTQKATTALPVAFELAQASSENASVDVAASEATPAVASEEPPAANVPTYPTRLPAAATLQYELQYGGFSGEGRLVWQLKAGAYEISLDGLALGLNLLSWSSRGHVDAAGLAPVRFVDRRRRDERAANFQRDAGRITYSGPSTEYPLVPGAQDRLSFMVQLAAIVAANPPRFKPGTPVSMFVTGARGDGDVWTFTVMSEDALDLPSGRLPRALHLRREPRKPFDQRVDVWLDPARGYLPVRVRMATEGKGNGEATELVLRRYTAT